jgi:altronate dehydratase
LGLPARCALLEEELLESDRELDFIDELWVRERAAGSRGFTALTAALTAAALVIAVIDGATMWVVIGVLGAAATLGVAHAEAAVDRARLRRIRDWHRRVGVPH